MDKTHKKIKVLLVYPQYPTTFWSFKHILKFVWKKSAFPPLGLLTVAALLPDSWEKKVVDMNVENLNDKDLAWCDYLFISGMIVQKESMKKVIKRAHDFNCKVVGGGPLLTTSHEEFEGIDHLVLGEAEVTLPEFLRDLEEGTPKRLYASDERPDIRKTPVPLWDLINMKHYATMSVQYSRGCPFDCEFCDIIIMNGRVPRTKSKRQVLGELRVLYKKGWRGSLFIVDDNFIGHKGRVKEMLRGLMGWTKRRKFPFALFTEASLDLADDKELLKMMVDAGFDKVFLGIETPDEASLAECNKFQNNNRDLGASIKTIQKSGLEVMGGFIVGFDNDTPSIFKRQLDFIQKNGIVTAMVGLLNALPGTKLYNRLKQEGRLVKDTTGDNTDGGINFIPKMNFDVLKDGYRDLVEKIYSPKSYYERIINFLRHYKPSIKTKFSFIDVKAFIHSIWALGIAGRDRIYYWKLVFVSLFRYPKAFPKAITLAIYGYHFRKVAGLN